MQRHLFNGIEVQLGDIWVEILALVVEHIGCLRNDRVAIVQLVHLGIIEIVPLPISWALAIGRVMTKCQTPIVVRYRIEFII